ncbi:MAG: VCBS repeat-containing protein [Bacteroidales bacterium]|nr:VCBS repeat-containing protein [Bacteroidales bacterium]
MKKIKIHLCRAAKLLSCIAMLLSISARAHAQVSLSVSQLTWEANETDTKYVTVSSFGGNGRWECDSTVYSNHFYVSPISGSSGSSVAITPMSTVTGDAIDGGIGFYNPNTGAWASLDLLHKGPAGTFSVSPLTLSWGSSETQSQPVTVTGDDWSSSVSGGGFSRVENTSAGTITVTPDGQNTGSARNANLVVSNGESEKYVWLHQDAGSYNGGNNGGNGGYPSTGQITISPSATIRWSPYETDAKYVVVSSTSGAWRKDTCSLGPHFSMSPTLGSSGEMAWFTPSGSNETLTDIEDAVFIETHYGQGGAQITLIHEHDPYLVKPEADSLVWSDTQTNWRGVTVTSAINWTARIAGGGFKLNSSGGSGTGTISACPSSANPTTSDIVAWLELSAPGARTRSVKLIQHGRSTPAVVPDTFSGSPGQQIPVSRGVTPTGAVTYAVPVMTDPVSKYAPAISLVYNSQSGNGIAGYGWHISGLSSITLIPQNRYYHGRNKAADVNGSDHSYALDGVPLVESEEYAAGTTTYPLKTVRGHVRVKRTASGFEALYPDGSRAVFGEGPATGGNTRLVYPVVRKEDILDNEITFSYLMDGGTCYPQTICYDTGLAAPDTIRFTYADRSDYVPQYSAGVEVCMRKLLTGITSSAGGEILRSYTLSHGTIYGVSCLLELGCSTGSGNGTESLEPLRFEYGGGVGMPGMTFDANYVQTSVVSPYGDTNEDSGYYTSRGKFVANGFQDGVIVVPKKPIFTLLADSPLLGKIYGSGYDSEHISYVPSSEITPFTISVGNGFQDVQGLDCDGDGIDEVIRIRMLPDQTLGKTKLSISRIKYNPANDLTWVHFDNYLDGFISNPLFGSPQRRCYRYGTLTQDGHAQLITTSLSNDGFGHSLTSKTAVIDLMTGEVLAEESIFQIDYISEKYHFVADLDGDGISEICYITSNGTEIYGFRDNGSFGLLKTYYSLKRSDLVNGYQLADINGDGNLDFVCTSNLDDAWDVFCFTGNTFVKKKYIFGKTDFSTKVLFMDLNKDGLQDMMRLNINGSVTYRLNVGGSMATEEMTVPFTIPYKSEVLQGNVLDFRSSTGFVVVNEGKMKGYGFNGDYRSLRLATKMRDSFHNEYTDSYADISESGSCYSNPGGDAPQGGGYSERSIPIRVVHESLITSGGVLQDSTSRSYRNATLSTEGAGFVCFGAVTENQITGGKTVVTHYAADAMGAPSSVETFATITGGRVQIGAASYTFAADTNAFGNVVDARITEAALTDQLKGVTEVTVTVYDGYGLPISVTASRRIGNGNPKTEVKTISYSHGLSDSLYVLGAVAEEQLHKGSLVSKTEYTLDSLKRPTRTMAYAGTVSGGSTAWNLTSDCIVTYDAYGNVISDRTAAYGATTYNESTYAYDANGRYLISSTDPLGRTTTYLNYNKYGQPAQAFDWLGRQTLSSYDTWGNLISKTDPDSTVTVQTKTWSASGEPGLYCVSKTVTGQPDTKVWYDALGREVRDANKRFDGSWQYVTTEYDGRGRLYRTSHPYKNTATGPTLWNTYTYDSYDRPTSLTEAGGKQTTWSYSGTSTTTIKEGISSTSTTDAGGNVIGVTDAGGAISYTLRPDGQPSSVTVTPAGTNQSIETSFTYDVYGRRTALVDPSAGTRTDTYTDNADGSSSVAHTGPNGTVTTYYDRFGRVTYVTRPEFNTSYTYGTTLYDSSYGKLLSEASTNGTSRSFTYDNLGRPATETEYVDSTNWLRRTYSYGAGSNVASINYTSQDGSITTETFSYANGHNTAISASGSGNTSINVFTLTGENALGQPTSATTGGVTRNYGYTGAGIPSLRRIRDNLNNTVQQFTYSYAPAFGNMLDRADAVLGLAEEFSYDVLNRLISSQQTDQSGLDTLSRYAYRYDSAQTAFDTKGNLIGRSYDGIMSLDISYDNPSNPYEATSADSGDTMEGGYSYPMMGPCITMTSFDRPASVYYGAETPYLAYKYNASGEKAKMTMNDTGFGVRQVRYYLGGVYEKDENTGDTITQNAERLFLGGTAYDAPMVLAKSPDVNEGVWTPFNIGRDAQGSITEVLTADGEIVERFRYDPWGIQLKEFAIDTCVVDVLDSLGIVEESVMADTLAVPEVWQMAGLSVYVGSHGYTGHEHIYGLGLINCNARFYDPAIGRFLSPDPLIQDPASTQNLNRYAYCLNNPLKYTDESGEIIGTVLTAVVRGVGTIVSSAIKAIEGGIDNGWQGAKNGFVEEWKQYGRRVANAAKIDWGLLRTDSNNSFWENAGLILSRFTWELPQTIAGNLTGHFRNNFWRVNVDYYQDATLINRNDTSTWKWGFTLGSYVNGKNLIANPQLNGTFGHEYGHIKQSNYFGWLYIPLIGIPSSIGCAFDNKWGHNHGNEWYEVWANKEADKYYNKIGDSVASKTLANSGHVLVRTGVDWYDYATFIYYALLCFIL